MMMNIKLTQKCVLGLSASLAALVLITLVLAFWQWQSDWALAHQPIAVAKALSTNDAAARLINDIPSDHLFGQSLASGNVPISNLQLRVTGIVKVENDQTSEASKAYIAIAGQPGKIYQIGDNLPDGVKVYEITPDAVILKNDDHLEKLPLPREKLQFKPRNEEY